MGDYFNDEIYAESSDEYEAYFSKNMKNRGSKNDKIHEDMISKYDTYSNDMSNLCKKGKDRSEKLKILCGFR